MKTYEVTLSVEMMATFKVRAKSADEANQIATDRMEALCNRLEKGRKSVLFGDPVDHIPARD